MKHCVAHNLNAGVAVAVARHLNAPVTFVRASPRDPAHEAEFGSINPNTLVPVPVEGNTRRWQTDAIACRLSQVMRWDFWREGGCQAQVIMWMSCATHHLTRGADPACFERVPVPTVSPTPLLDPAVIGKGLRGFRKFAEILDAGLRGRDGLVGNRLSDADFRVATALPFAEPAGLPLEGLAEVQRWHAQLMTLDAWRDPSKGLD